MGGVVVGGNWEVQYHLERVPPRSPEVLYEQIASPWGLVSERVRGLYEGWCPLRRKRRRQCSAALSVCHTP